ADLCAEPSKTVQAYCSQFCSHPATLVPDEPSTPADVFTRMCPPAQASDCLAFGSLVCQSASAAGQIGCHPCWRQAKCACAAGTILPKGSAQCPCLDLWGWTPGGPPWPRWSRALPVSRLSGRIDGYGTAACAQDLQIPAHANARAGIGVGEGRVALPRALQ